MAGGRLGHTTVLQIKQKGGPCLLNQAGTEDHDPKWGWARRGEAFPGFVSSPAQNSEITRTDNANQPGGQAPAYARNQGRLDSPPCGPRRLLCEPGRRGSRLPARTGPHCRMKPGW